MENIYEWGASLNSMLSQIDPQVAGEELERVRNKNKGELTNKALVNSQRKKNAPLHNCFEWDDGKAANKHRERQASEIIRSVRVAYQKSDGEQKTIRAYSSIRKTDEVTERPRYFYTDTVEALQDDDLKKHILEAAFRGLNAWRKRWADLNECTEALCDVDLALKKIDNQIKKSHKKRPAKKKAKKAAAKKKAKVLKKRPKKKSAKKKRRAVAA